MIDLNVQTLSNSLIASWIAMTIALVIQIYVIYLNWKQSKVRDQMNELITKCISKVQQLMHFVI